MQCLFIGFQKGQPLASTNLIQAQYILSNLELRAPKLHNWPNCNTTAQWKKGLEMSQIFVANVQLLLDLSTCFALIFWKAQKLGFLVLPIYLFKKWGRLLSILRLTFRCFYWTSSWFGITSAKPNINAKTGLGISTILMWFSNIYLSNSAIMLEEAIITPNNYS